MMFTTMIVFVMMLCWSQPFQMMLVLMFLVCFQMFVQKHKNAILMLVALVLFLYLGIVTIYPKILKLSFNIEKFEQKVDERFTAQSYAQGVTGNNYSFDGVKSVNVYSMPIAPLTDYDRSRTIAQSRYGTLTDLQAAVQKMSIEQDKSFTFEVVDQYPKAGSKIDKDEKVYLYRE